MQPSVYVGRYKQRTIACLLLGGVMLFAWPIWSLPSFAQNSRAQQLTCDSDLPLEIVKAQAVLGDIDSALENARKFVARDLAIGEVVEGLAETSQFDRALQTLDLIQDGERRTTVLEFIAGKQTKAGAFQSAIATIALIANVDKSAYPMRLVVEAQAAANDFEGAIQTLRSMPRSRQQFIALSNLVDLMVDKGQQSNARILIDEHISMLDRGGPQADASIVGRSIASALASIGDIGRALETARSLDDNRERSYALRLIATSLRRDANPSQADEIGDESLAVARQVASAYDRANELREHAVLRAHAGRAELAKALMDEARQVALAMGEENWQRGTALGLVAASQAELGLVDAALETARSIGDEIERIQEISDVARIAITKGNDDEARAAFEEAVEVASDLEFFEDQLDGLYWIARNQTHAGEINGAIEIAGNMVKEGQAKGAIPLLKANRESARVLAEVAMQLFRTDPHQARKHVEEALALACEEQTAKPSLSLAGTYTAQGSNPDGSQYSGTCEITAMGADEYQFQWAVGGNYTGTGTLNGDTITVDWGSDAPVIYKVQADRSLVGTWANGRATEILKRQ